MIHPIVMRWIILLSLILVSSSGFATESVAVGEGVAMVVEGAALSVRANGKIVWEKTLPDMDAKAPASLKQYEIDDAYNAVHLAAPQKTGGVYEAVFLLKKNGATRPKVVWEGSSALSGDIGERTGQAVRFEDLSGDGRPEIVVGTVSEGVKLCGQAERPLLFRRVFDVKTGKFRPVLAKRMGVATPVDIDGAFITEQTPPPILNTLFAASASRTADDKGDVFLLSKPAVLVDGSSESAWSPWPGNGAGEFVTFTTLSDAYGITKIGIEPFRGQVKKKPYDRPKTLLMTTESDVYRLKFNKDAGTLPEGIFWFALPKPVKTGCLSLVVESTYAGKKRSPLALAEVETRTELDGPKGLERLARDLGDEQRRRQATRLLKAAGKRAASPVAASFDALDTAGKRLAVEVLAEVDPKGGIDMLVRSALGEDDVARRSALNGLKRAPGDAVRALSAVLMSKDASKATAAAGIIADLGTPESLKVLTDRVGEGTKAFRQRIRRAIRRLGTDGDDAAEELWKAVQASIEEHAWERTVDLLRVAVSIPSLGERVHAYVETVFDSKPQFEDRYRLLSILGQLECGYSQDRLLTALDATDPQIRAVAVTGLGGCVPLAENVVTAVRAALRDTATPVRLAAVSVIATGGAAEGAVDALGDLVGTDPWPEVRAGATAAVFRLSPERALPLLEAAEKDVSPMVRRAALMGAMRFSSQRADAIISRRLSDSDEETELRIRATVAAARRCQTSALPAMFSMLKIGAEPLAKQEDVEMAVAAARAMGQIGTTAAKEMLTEARKRSNPATDKAIDAALQIEHGCNAPR